MKPPSLTPSAYRCAGAARKVPNGAIKVHDVVHAMLLAITNLHA